MAKNICYRGEGGFRVDEIADAVSLHLNFLGTGKGDTNLNDVREMIVENIDRAHMSQDLDDEFQKLLGVNPGLASDLRRKLLHQKILAKVVHQVFDKVKSKINVIDGQYEQGQAETIFVDMKPILDTRNYYSEQIRAAFERDRFNLENRIKPVLEQVVEPRFDDLSLSQAKLGAELKDQFARAEDQRSGMEERLLKKLLTAIEKNKNG
jgi:hypothetical protein